MMVNRKGRVFWEYYLSWRKWRKLQNFSQESSYEARRITAEL